MSSLFLIVCSLFASSALPADLSSSSSSRANFNGELFIRMSFAVFQSIYCLTFRLFNYFTCALWTSGSLCVMYLVSVFYNFVFSIVRVGLWFPFCHCRSGFCFAFSIQPTPYPRLFCTLFCFSNHVFAFFCLYANVIIVTSWFAIFVEPNDPFVFLSHICQLIPSAPHRSPPTPNPSLKVILNPFFRKRF